MKKVICAAAAVLALAGCSSSGGETSETDDSVPSCDAACVSEAVGDTYGYTEPAPGPTTRAVKPRPRPSDIVDNYDTATCADWNVTTQQNKVIVAEYFAVTKAKDLGDIGYVLVGAINTACTYPGVPRTVTVRKVALLSIRNLRNGS
ncbi:hypothetical protein [Jatrophihabitans fulvus]